MSENSTHTEKETLKRAKKHHLVFPILASCAVLFIALFIFFCVIGYGLNHVVTSKLFEGNQYANVLAEAIEEKLEAGQTLEDAGLGDNTFNYPVQICDAEGNIVYTTGSEEQLQYYDVLLPSLSCRVACEKLGLSIVETNSDIIVLNQKDFLIFWKPLNQAIFSQDSTSILLFRLKLWSVSDPVCDGAYTVNVMTDLSIYGRDLYSYMIIVFMTMGTMLLVVIVFMVDIFRSLLSHNRLLNALYLDETTDGKNWLYFKGTAEKYLSRPKCNYALVLVDNTRYAHMCTCYGGEYGSRLLQTTYRFLQTQLVGRELACRHSDADFGLLLAYTTQAQLTDRLEILRAGLEQAISLEDSLHLGVVLLPAKENVHAKEAAEWGFKAEYYYHLAKLACDSLKADEERNLCFFDDELLTEQLWRHKVESRMQEALQNEEFQVYLQPKYDPSTAKLKGAEALIRWITPEDGMIAPGRFIPIFEENGSITLIDDYMISHVATLVEGWLAEGYEVVPISVNVSRAHFAQADLAENIARLVDEHHVPHRVIEIELTESAFFDDKKALITIVHRLQELGFMISMDDFGSGYSSLNSLKDLPLNVLKLDAEFFRGEEVYDRGETVVRKAIELAKSLNMEVVAEGVEEKEQVDFLAGVGCDMIQGYYFDKPLPVDEFLTRMDK